MKCIKESHRSLFLRYRTCLPGLVLLCNRDQTPQIDFWTRSAIASDMAHPGLVSVPMIALACTSLFSSLTSQHRAAIVNGSTIMASSVNHCRHRFYQQAGEQRQGLAHGWWGEERQGGLQRPGGGLG